MKTTQKAVKALSDAGMVFPTQGNRLDLVKKDAKNVPQSTGIHKVKILRDEKRMDIHVFISSTGFLEVQGIRFWFDEGGEEKFYDVPFFNKDDYKRKDFKASDPTNRPHYLLERFAEIEEGTELELEFMRRGTNGFIDVRKVGEESITGKHEGDEGGLGDDLFPNPEDDLGGGADEVPF